MIHELTTNFLMEMEAPQAALGTPAEPLGLRSATVENGRIHPKTWLEQPQRNHLE